MHHWQRPSCSLFFINKLFQLNAGVKASYSAFALSASWTAALLSPGTLPTASMRCTVPSKSWQAGSGSSEPEAARLGAPEVRLEQDPGVGGPRLELVLQRVARRADQRPAAHGAEGPRAATVRRDDRRLGEVQAADRMRRRSALSTTSGNPAQHASAHQQSAVTQSQTLACGRFRHDEPRSSRSQLTSA